MTKVLIVTDSWPPNCGGAGWATYNLVLGLSLKGYNIEVITMNKPDAIGELHNNFTVRNFNGFSQTVYKKIRKYVKENKDKYDIVISTYLHSTRAVAGLDIPHITMIHDYWPICYKGLCRNNVTGEQYERSTLQNIYRSLTTEYKWPIRLLAPLITPYMMWRTKQGLKAINKSTVIAFNSDYSYYRLLNEVSPFISKKIVTPPIMYNDGSGGDIPIKDYLLFVGKFNQYKGKDEIIRLSKLIRRKIVIIGDCDEPNLPDNVCYLGYKPNKEVKNYMRNAYAVLVPSQGEETYGMTAQEALYCGTPVICTDKGAVKEVVEHCITGYVCPPTYDSMFLGLKYLDKHYLNIKKNIQNRQNQYKEQYFDTIEWMSEIIEDFKK